MSTLKLVPQFKAARRAGAPLLAIRTPDPAATIAGITAALNGTAPPVIQWDAVRGLAGVNAAGAQAVKTLCGDKPPALTTANGVAAMDKARELPDGSILFALNVHQYVEGQRLNPQFVQSIANLRDLFKSNQRQLVMLAPSIMLPAELQGDTVVLNEPLPTAEELEVMVDETYNAAGLGSPEVDTKRRAVQATLGLAAFAAEQALAMSISKTGLDTKALWSTKVEMVEQTPGVSIEREVKNFGMVKGNANVKSFFNGFANSPRRPRCILFLDELEKMVAGRGDTSGVSQGLLERFLSWTQGVGAMGVLLTGVPGAGKSATAKALGGELEVPVINLSLSSIKGSLVGESERNLDRALKVVDSVAQGDILMVATSNRMEDLPPELKSRFRLGTFFYDFPSAEERDAIWLLYMNKFGLADQPIPDADKWVGREIEACCESAWLRSCPLADAASYIVPVASSAADDIDAIRRYAEGRFISSSFPGLYTCKQKAEAPSKGRRISVEA